MKNKRVQNDLAKRERFSLTPLAIPMLAGPGSISMQIALNQKHQETTEILITMGAILAVCIATFAILRSSYFIVRFLGASGINAISRIIGFIIIAIGIEYISSSVVSILKSVML